MNLVEVVLLTAITTGLLSFTLRMLFGNAIIRPWWVAVLVALTTGLAAYFTLEGRHDPYAVSTALTKGVVTFILIRVFATVIPLDSEEMKKQPAPTNHPH